jgi:copper transport protein
VALALVAALALAATFAPSALAHSQLVATQPGEDQVLPVSPERVILEFNEPVDTSLGSLRVFDGQGRQVAGEEFRQPAPTTLVTDIDSPLAPGTYTVAWRVVSADSDPVSGAFVFHVVRRGVVASSASIDTLTGTSQAVDTLFAAARFFDLALLLLVVGGTTALVVALPSAAWPVRRRLYGILAALAGALALVALASIMLQGVAASGGSLGDAFSWNLFTTVLDTRYGGVLIVQCALAATLALTVVALRLAAARDRRLLAGLTFALAAGLVLTPSLSGHAGTLGGLGLVSDVVHVVAAAVWTGGLAFLVLGLLLAREDRWKLATRAVPRFSTTAVISVVALIVAGIVSAYLEVRTWRGLWETGYGRLLLAKIALLLPLLALGGYNNRYAVPRLEAGIASASERRRFLRVASAELGIMVAIVAVSAVLINTRPAATELGLATHGAAVEVTTTPTARPFVGPVELGDLRATVVVQPAAAGDNTIRVTFVPTGEQPSEVSVAASLPSRQIGPLDFTAVQARRGAAAWVVEDASLAIAGNWDLRIEALLGEFDLVTGTVTVPIQDAGARPAQESGIR